MRRSNYDKFPVTNITGEIWVGIEDIISQLQREIVKKDFILVVDCYVGVSLDKLYECLINLHPDLCINTECLMKPENEVRDMTYPYVTDDELFGYRTRLNISDFFDHEKVSAFRKRISSEKGIKIILGCGASWICPDADLLVYGDIARWELQQRFRRHEIKALGVDVRNESPARQYKRGYFCDWQVCDTLKKSIYEKVCYWLDMNIPLTPKMISKDTFMRGLAKKVILANTTGAVFEQIAAMHLGSYSVMTAWIGCISYSFQIYFDFGGYSDMAIGLGKMFGFEFLENFHYPYVSTSVTEFWRRWHISLSTWFREYVYIPLGGNRKGDSRTITNLLIVWMLTGFWHGAAWNFVAWGLYYGIILILEKFVWGQYVEKWPGAVRHIYAMVLILIGWVLFFSPSLGYALKYVGVMFGIGASGLMDKLGWFYLLSNWLIYLMAVLGSSSIGYRLMRNIQRAPGSRVGKYIMTGVMYLVMFALSLAFLVTQSFNPFLYFRF